MRNFHGSYFPDDVTILLDPILVNSSGLASDIPQAPEATPYSVQIASEEPLGAEYIGYFYAAVERHKKRLALDVLQVARVLAARDGDEVVLTSLVRGGTPVGVLLHRALVMLGRRNIHYSISATRKRGSDPSALDHILSTHNASDICFVDGWTGKGYIASELKTAMAGFNASRGTNVEAGLVVLADLAGVSAVAASSDDYLIPSAMLRSTVCGLISASMLNPRGQSGLPDACLYYEHLLRHDCSIGFIEVIAQEMVRILPTLDQYPLVSWGDDQRQQARIVSDAFVSEVMVEYGITDRNKVKPGICEANRALLTRTNELKLVVRDLQADADDLANLLFLARMKGVSVTENASLPYQAVVLLNS